MNNKIKLLLLIILVLPFTCLATTATPPPPAPPPPPELVTELDLAFIYGGDFYGGYIYSEEEIVSLLSQYPNLLALNLSGQVLTPAIGEALATKPLVKLSLRGNIAHRLSDDRSESFDTLIEEEINADFLAAFIQGGGTKLKVLDLDFSTINDDGLILLGGSAPFLEELSLVCCTGITDVGIRLLLAQCPKLKTIHLGRAVLLRGDPVPLTISYELIQELQISGICIIIQERHPFYQ